MGSEHEYGTEILDFEEIRKLLEPTLQVRLALEVLWRSLPPDIETEAIGKSLWQIHEQVCAREYKAMREHGLNLRYTIIKPLNMRNLPDPETMRKIADAAPSDPVADRNGPLPLAPARNPPMRREPLVIMTYLLVISPRRGVKVPIRRDKGGI